MIKNIIEAWQYSFGYVPDEYEIEEGYSATFKSNLNDFFGVLRENIDSDISQLKMNIKKFRATEEDVILHDFIDGIMFFPNYLTIKKLDSFDVKSVLTEDADHNYYICRTMDFYYDALFLRDCSHLSGITKEMAINEYPLLREVLNRNLALKNTLPIVPEFEMIFDVMREGKESLTTSLRDLNKTYLLLILASSIIMTEKAEERILKIGAMR